MLENEQRGSKASQMFGRKLGDVSAGTGRLTERGGSNGRKKGVMANKEEKGSRGAAG